MKNLYLLAFTFIVFGSLLGQKDRNNYDSKWFIGFNTGVTWSSSDIDNSWKWRASSLDVAQEDDDFRFTRPSGWGIVLGKSFNYDYGKFLSFDIRGRYLHGHWYGQNTAIDTSITSVNDDAQLLFDQYTSAYGGFVPNYHTDLRRLSLELVIHLNKLREKTGLDAYIFGGVGISWKTIKADLTSLETGTIYSEQQMLDEDLDFIYETDLINKQKYFMPSLGFGLAYDFGRTSIGLEHKTTFTRGDQFDGYISEIPRFENDLYHYTSAFIKFRLGGSNNSSRPTSPKPPTSSSGFTSCPTPVVSILNTNNSTSNEGTTTINAQLTNVNAVSQIKLTDMNQMPLPFDYDSFSNKVTATVSLVPGNNTFFLRATTNCGSDMARLNLQNTTSPSSGFTSCPSPLVNILNANNTSVSEGTISLSAQIENVNDVSEIKFTNANQIQLPFNFDSNTKTLNALVTLVEGNNTFYISAANNCGSDTDRLNIQYSNCSIPTGAFISPTSNITVDAPNLMIQARVLEISDASLLEVYLNNSQVFGFSFNPSTGLLISNLSLNQGQNTIRIDFENECGSGTISNSIIFEECETPNIEMILPSASGATTNNQNQNIEIQITGSDITINNIAVKLNGAFINIASASYANHQLNFAVVLVPGINNISVVVQNECASDTKSFMIDLEDCDAPSIVFNNSQTGLITLQANLNVNITVNEVFGAQNISYNLNGQAIQGLQYNTQSNTLSGQIVLIPGDNFFTVSASNDCGNDVETLHVIYNDCKDPMIAITSQGSLNGGTNTTVTNSSYTIAANLSNVNTSNEISIKHNGQYINFSFVNSVLMSNVVLGPGLNTFKIVVTTPCGNASVELTIVYDDCQPPSISLKVPTSNAVLSTSQKIQLIAKLMNINTSSQITVQNGGISIPFAFNNGILKSQINLVDGNNSIVLNVKNPCGEDTELIIIEYLPCDIPEIVLDNSSIPSVITSSNVSINAAIFNDQPSTTITINVNGNTLPASNHQIMNGTLTGSIPLILGQNTISIYAVNPCGSDSESFSILRCKNPSVNWINPALVNTVVTNESFNLEAMANNALDAANIQFSFNGSPQGFDFDISNEKLTKTVILVPGDNVFAIRIQNACGAANSSITVIYDTLNGQNGNGSNNGNGMGNSNGNEGGPGNNNGHGNNTDGVDVSNPGQGNGGPNGQEDESGDEDDENQGVGTNMGGNTEQGNGTKADAAAKAKAAATLKAKADADAKAKAAATLKAKADAAAKAKAAATLKAKADADAKAKAAATLKAKADAGAKAKAAATLKANEPPEKKGSLTPKTPAKKKENGKG